MESVEFEQNGDCINDLSAEKLLSLDCLDACGVFGDPKMLPRVGAHYQVDIPAPIPRLDYVCYMKSSAKEVNKDPFYCNFWKGFLIPVTHFNKDTKKMKDAKQEFSSDLTDLFNRNVPPKFESLRDTTLWYQYPLWTDIEKESFLLGLYIFEKNFVQLKRFVETKRMGDIQSFYYGVFYRSNEYNRWSKCLKRRSKKRVYGQRIFTGLRQRELLSRVLPQMSEEFQKALLEISKTFGEEKVSLEEFVFSLKAMVGMNIFVEAVGIGKGNQDLTCMTIKPLKSYKAPGMPPEIYTGKAWSALMSTEIMKFLTGDLRLSRAQANDLFWEAVWPRLLARGWHSEQPKRQNYVPGAKLSLVFLIPGVEKFSERRLKEGNHYFTSVTAVLNKVCLEPGLLEFKIEEDEGNHKWTSEIREEDDSPERRRCYLQPRTRSGGTDVTNFAVVDTSLARGKMLRFRELKTLPTKNSGKKSFSEDGHLSTPEVSDDKLASDCNMVMDHEETGNIFDSKTSSSRGINLGGEKDLDISFSIPPVRKAKKRVNLCKEKETLKNKKSHLSQKLKRNDLGCLASVTKRHRMLSACTSDAINSRLKSSQMDHFFGENLPSCSSDSPYLTKAVSQLGWLPDRWFSSTISSKSSCPKSTEDAPDDDYDTSPQPQIILDLNLAPLPLDCKNDVLMTDLRNGKDDMTSEECGDLNAPKTSEDVMNYEMHDNMNSRRQSRRNRPPTAKALEALVNGYLTTTGRQKREGNANEDSASRPPRRTQIEVEWSGLAAKNAVLARDMFEKFNVFPIENRAQVSNSQHWW